jgi:hypothetical protein
VLDLVEHFLVHNFPVELDIIMVQCTEWACDMGKMSIEFACVVLYSHETLQVMNVF